MKNALARLFGSLWSGLATGMVVGLALVIPVATSAATEATLSVAAQAANISAGDTGYREGVSAKVNQVVKIQAYYQTTSADAAGNVRLKLALPNKAGAKQTVTATVSADNAKAATSSVTVSLDQENALLQYIPGTALWKRNTGSAGQPKITESKLSDDIVGGQGVALDPAVKPGAEFGGTVTIQARVLAPGVNVSFETEVKGESSKWSTNNSAKPTDTLRYLISYQNTSNQQQKQVVVRSILPAGVTIVPGSTLLYSSANGNGTKIGNDAVTAGGVVIGNYGPGSNAYVSFEATVAADKLLCGNNELRASGSVKPQDGSEYFGTAVTTIKRECNTVPNAAPSPSAQPAAAYSCDALTVTKGEGRSMAVKVDYTAKDGASFKSVRYDFGDGSEPLLTDKTNVNYSYQKDGTYIVTATVTVTAAGKDQTATGAACSKQVSFGGTTAATPAMKGNDLPNSGPGSLVVVFVGASLLGCAIHHLVAGRRFARR